MKGKRSVLISLDGVRVSGSKGSRVMRSRWSVLIPWMGSAFPEAKDHE